MGIKPHHYGTVGVSTLSSFWGLYLLLTEVDPVIRATGLGLALFAAFSAATFYMVAIGAGQNPSSNV